MGYLGTALLVDNNHNLIETLKKWNINMLQFHEIKNVSNYNVFFYYYT